MFLIDLLKVEKLPSDLVEDKFTFPAVVISLCALGYIIIGTIVALVEAYVKGPR